jgi:SAM-dependent methyltransferase
MYAIDLLKHAISQKPASVLDLGVGPGHHARAFMSTGSFVTGVDIQPDPMEKDKAAFHDRYNHVNMAIEHLEKEEEAEPYDVVWSCHVLQHLSNVQSHLIQIKSFLKDDGWLYIAVPVNPQERMHVGHLSVWTPALLLYNLICAGWDCSDAKWYTSYQTIGLCLKKKLIEDMSWRVATTDEEDAMNQYAPIPLRHEYGAWLANNWHETLMGRVQDPPSVTAGVYQTNLPPIVQLAYGPNPKLREGYHG